MAGLWRQQLKALMIKFWLTKTRKRRQLIGEIVYPLIFVGIIFATNQGSSTSTEQPAVLEYPLQEPPPLMSFCQVEFARGASNCVDLAYAPASGVYVTPIINAIVEDTYMRYGVNLTTVGYADDTAVQDAFDAGVDGVWSAVVFTSERDINLEYSIRIAEGLTYGSTSDTMITGGYLSLQQALYSAVINVFAGNSSSGGGGGGGGERPWVSLSLSAQELPTPAQPPGFNANALAPFYFVFIFSYISIQTTIGVVTEKRDRIRISFRVLGVSDGIYWLTWLLAEGAICVITVAIFLLVTYLTSLYHYSNMIFLAIMFLSYAATQLATAIMVSAAFDKPRVASGATTLILFGSVALYAMGEYLVLSRDDLFWLKILISFFPAVPFGHIVSVGATLETAGDGLGFGSLGREYGYPGYSVGLAYLFVVLDGVLYLLLAIYLDKVVPGEFGNPVDRCFCIKGSFWRGTKRREVPYGRRGAGQGSPEEADPRTPLVGGAAPAATPGQVFVEAHGITKVYPGADGARAVDNVSLDVACGEILCLLGANGAGKTTTLSMLMGLTASTEGQIIIRGVDVTHAPAGPMLGVCPQKDTLIESLTVREHLQLWARLKGIPWSYVDGEVEDAVEDLGLGGVVGNFADGLSGGQKRKLSVALAFIGPTEIVFLDEPSSGMDPHSRKVMWSVLQRHKATKAMILTTHYMEEADALGDRIAILSRGHMAVEGTSLHLKSHFGLGYHLSLVRNEGCDTGRVTEFVTSKIQGAQPHHDVGSELTYILPMSAVAEFGPFLQELEDSLDALRLRSYGVSMTTLEEVFLRIAEREHRLEGFCT